MQRGKCDTTKLIDPATHLLSDSVDLVVQANIWAAQQYTCAKLQPSGAERFKAEAAAFRSIALKCTESPTGVTAAQLSAKRLSRLPDALR